jgi:hypothetical protein
MSVSVPLSYLLLNTRKVAAKGKRTERIARWFQCLKEGGLKPRWILTDKDLAEVTASRRVWADGNHQLCHWHAHRAIEKRLKHCKPKPRRRGGEEPGGDEPGGDEPRRNQPHNGESEDDIPNDAGENQGENWTRNLINEADIPEHLRFLLHHVDWINSEDAKEAPDGRLLNDDQIKELKKMCAQHFTAHPWVPIQFGGDAEMNPPVTAPEEMLERRLRIHSHAVRETLEWCIREGSPGTFRYLWANWYRCAFANRGP